MASFMDVMPLVPPGGLGHAHTSQVQVLYGVSLSEVNVKSGMT